MSAEMKEIIIDADARNFEKFSDDSGERFFDRSARGDKILLSSMLGAGNAARSIFPFGVNGSDSIQTNADGSM